MAYRIRTGDDGVQIVSECSEWHIIPDVERINSFDERGAPPAVATTQGPTSVSATVPAPALVHATNTVHVPATNAVQPPVQVQLQAPVQPHVQAQPPVQAQPQAPVQPPVQAQAPVQPQQHSSFSEQISSTINNEDLSSATAPALYKDIREEYLRLINNDNTAEFIAQINLITVKKDIEPPTDRVKKLRLDFCGKTHDLPNGKYLLGRKDICRFVTPNILNAVSRIQCLLIVEDGRVIIIDYWSVCGTEVQTIDTRNGDNSAYKKSYPVQFGVRQPIILDTRDAFFEFNARIGRTGGDTGVELYEKLFRIYNAASCQLCALQQYKANSIYGFTKFVESAHGLNFCKNCIIEQLQTAPIPMHDNNFVRDSNGQFTPSLMFRKSTFIPHAWKKMRYTYCTMRKCYI